MNQNQCHLYGGRECVFDACVRVMCGRECECECGGVSVCVCVVVFLYCVCARSYSYSVCVFYAFFISMT